MTVCFGRPQTKKASYQHVPQPPFPPLLGLVLTATAPPPAALQAQWPLSPCLARGGAGLRLAGEEVLLAVPLSLVKVVASCLRGAGLPGHPSMPATGPEGLRAAITLKVTSGQRPEAQRAVQANSSHAAPARARPAVSSAAPL